MSQPTPTASRRSRADADAAVTAAPTTGRRLEVRQSAVHGRGVFARRALAKGERVIEYTGEIITWKEAQRRHPHDPAQPDHTFYFHLDDARVIDGLHHGNIAKWINHACGPNCEAEQDGDRVFLYALRDIAPGEELSFDYGLIIDERMTPALKARFACHCGTPECRGMMLAPRRGSKSAKAPAEPKANTKADTKANTKAVDGARKSAAGTARAPAGPKRAAKKPGILAAGGRRATGRSKG